MAVSKIDGTTALLVDKDGSGGHAAVTSVTKSPGGGNLNHNQVALSTTAATLVAANATRRSVTIKNTDAAIVIYIGKATVTAGNGFPLKAGESISIDWTGLIQGIAASGTPAAAYVETYD